MGIVPALQPFIERDLRGAFYYWASGEFLAPCYILRRDIELSDDKAERSILEQKYKLLRSEAEGDVWKTFYQDFFTTISGIRAPVEEASGRELVESSLAKKLTPDFSRNVIGNETVKFVDVRVRALAPLEIAMRFDADLWEPGQSAFRALREDYRVVMHRGMRHELGELQAKAIQRLNEALALDYPALNSKQLMYEIGAQGHIADLFKGDKRSLIELVNIGYVRLNVFEDVASV